MLVWLIVMISLLSSGLGRVKAQGPKPVLLRYSHPAGKRLIYEIKSTMDINSLGKTYKFLVKMKEIYQLQNAKKDGFLNLLLELTDVQESYYISSRLFRGDHYNLLKGKYSFSLSPKGIISDFAYFASENSRAGRKHPSEFALVTFDMDYFNQFPILPDHPVTVGDSWTSERTIKRMLLSKGFEMKISDSSTFHIKKETSKDGFGCFEIEMVSQTTGHMLKELGDILMVMDMDGKYKTNILFDYERGIIRRLKSEGKFYFIGAPFGMRDEIGYESKQEMVGTSEMKLISIEPIEDG